MAILRQPRDFDSMSERNLDAKGVTSYRFTQKTMLPILGIVARIAISLGGAFILSKTAPSIRSSRFKFCHLVLSLSSRPQRRDLLFAPKSRLSAPKATNRKIFPNKTLTTTPSQQSP